MTSKVEGSDQNIEMQFDHKQTFAAIQEAEHNQKANLNAYIFDFPQHVKVDYGSTFLEPAAYQEKGLGKYMSKPLNWFFGSEFDYIQTGFYYVLTAIVGIFLSLVWGIVFGLFSFVLVWAIQPVLKIFYHLLRLFASLLRPCIRIMLDPLFESCGLLFSSIHGKFTLSMFGLDKLVRDIAATETPAIEHI